MFDAAEPPDHLGGHHAGQGDVVYDHGHTCAFGNVLVIAEYLIFIVLEIKRRHTADTSCAGTFGMLCQIHGSPGGHSAYMDDHRQLSAYLIHHDLHLTFALVRVHQETLSGGAGQIQSAYVKGGQKPDKCPGVFFVQAFVLVENRKHGWNNTLEIPNVIHTEITSFSS